MIDGGVASIAALGELVIGDGEFCRILLLDGGFECADRLCHRCIYEFRNWKAAEPRLRLNDAGEGLSNFHERIRCKRPILGVACKSEFGVPGLYQLFIMSPMVIM
jgi:hypothetical protein